jgi:hypothetical protein
MDYVAKAEDFPSLRPLTEGPLQVLRQPHRTRDGILFKIACSFLRAGTPLIVTQDSFPAAADSGPTDVTAGRLHHNST